MIKTLFTFVKNIYKTRKKTLTFAALKKGIFCFKWKIQRPPDLDLKDTKLSLHVLYGGLRYYSLLIYYIYYIYIMQLGISDSNFLLVSDMPICPDFPILIYAVVFLQNYF